MLLSEIREEVQLIMQDIDVFTDEIIDSYINDVYLSSVAECLVPELKGMDTVSTTLLQAYTSLSSVSGGFSGVLSRIYNSEGVNVAIVNNLETLIGLSGNLTDKGSVEAAALEGATLWYYPIPEVAEVLTVIYYKNPEMLSGDSDIPSAIPEFLHRKILVNGAAAICFDLVEDEQDATKVNMRSREMAMVAGVVKFKEWLGKTRKHYIFTQEPY